MSVIRFFNRSGDELAELVATAQYSWKLNEAGECTFILSTKELEGRVELIQFGNMIFIQDADLPAWGGVIDTPRNWGEDNVSVTAYSGEHFLTYRYRVNELPISQTAGEIFKKIIRDANKPEKLPIIEGKIWGGGKSREETLEPGNYYEDVKRIAEAARNDWNVVPQIESGKLQFYANWYKELGNESGVELMEGVNLVLEKSPLREQGAIVNELTGLGDGVTNEIRPVFVAVNKESLAQYGLRQGSAQFSTKEQTGTLETNTKNELVKQCQPRVTLRATALNVGNLFRELHLGDSVLVNLISAGLKGNALGFTERMRITGMTVAKKSVSLLLERIYENG